MKLRLTVLTLAALLAACDAGPSTDDAGQPGTGGGGGGAAGGGGGGTGGGGGGGELDAGEDAGEDAGDPLNDGGNDAGLSDAGQGDGGCRYKYCESFETHGGTVVNGAVVGPWKATVTGTGTTMAIDTLKPKSGAYSLHIAVPVGTTAIATLNQKAPAGLVPGNNLFGKAEIFYSAVGSNGLPLGVHSFLFDAKGTQTDGGTSTMNHGGGGAKLQINYHPPAPLTEKSLQGGVMTTGVWHCIQWQYDGSGNPPKNVAKLWIDGTLAVSVPATQGWTFPLWSTFDFGFGHYQTLANPVEIYLDDFALNNTMIPCP